MHGGADVRDDDDSNMISINKVVNATIPVPVSQK